MPSGLTANVNVTCHGVSGQRCAGRIELTTSQGGKRVVLGTGSYDLAAGASVTVPVELNRSGKRRLGRSFVMPVRVQFPAAAVAAKTVTFRIARIRANHHFLVWKVTIGTSTSAFSLVLRPVPKGASVTVACAGRGCPFAHKHVAAKGSRVSLTRLFGASRLKPGATVTFTITAPNHIGEVLRYALLAKPVIPSPVIKCAPPGSRRAAACNR